MKLEDSNLSIGTMGVIMAAIIGAIVWAMTFFAQASDTDARFNRQGAYMQRLDEKLDNIHGDILRILERMPK